jgi:hypothetical protein
MRVERALVLLAPALVALVVLLLVALNATTGDGASPTDDGRASAGSTRTAAADDVFPRYVGVDIESAFAWITNRADALAAARAEGKLILVYVHQSPRVCPACALIESEVFSRPEARVLARRYVPYRIDLDDPDLDAWERRLLVWQRVRWAPRLLALTAHGEVVIDDFGSMLPPMTVDGRPMAGTEDQIPALDRILAVLERAGAADPVQQERLEQLRSRLEQGEDGAAVALGTLLEQRMRIDEARTVYETELARGDRADVALRLVDLLERDGHAAEALTALNELVRRHPEHPQALTWRVRAFLMQPVAIAGEARPARMARLRALVREAAETGDDIAEARARIALGAEEAADGQREAALRHLRWFHDGARANGWSARMLLDLALLASAVDRPDVGVEYLEAVLRKYPEAPEADIVKHGMLGVMRIRAARAAEHSN